MNASHEDLAPAVAHLTLLRVLALFDATYMVVGSIIGSGIFLKIGRVDSVLASYGFLRIPPKTGGSWNRKVKRALSCKITALPP